MRSSILWVKSLERCSNYIVPQIIILQKDVSRYIAIKLNQ